MDEEEFAECLRNHVRVQIPQLAHTIFTTYCYVLYIVTRHKIDSTHNQHLQLFYLHIIPQYITVTQKASGFRLPVQKLKKNNNSRTRIRSIQLEYAQYTIHSNIPYALTEGTVSRLIVAYENQISYLL